MKIGVKGIRTAILNMKIGSKLTLVGLISLLPLGVLFYFVMDGISYNIHFNTLEKYGNEYQRPLERFLQHLSQHRLISRRYLSGNYHDSLKNDLLNKQSEIASDFQRLEGVDKRLAADLQVTQEGLAKRKRGHYSRCCF